MMTMWIRCIGDKRGQRGRGKKESEGEKEGRKGNEGEKEVRKERGRKRVISAFVKH